LTEDAMRIIIKGKNQVRIREADNSEKWKKTHRTSDSHTAPLLTSANDHLLVAT